MQQNVDPGSAIAQQYGLERSPLWPEAERQHRLLEPSCVACGYTGPGLQVHHILPFHFCHLLGRPELELDQRNLITLCEGATNHHLLLGHLHNWQSYNKEVRSDAVGAFHGMTDAQILADSAWQEKEQNRPLALVHMSDADTTAFKLLMDTMYPLPVATVTVEVTVQASVEIQAPPTVAASE